MTTPQAPQDDSMTSADRSTGSAPQGTKKQSQAGGRYGDRNASWEQQDAADDNWGIKPKKLDPQHIAELNAQALKAVRVPLRSQLPVLIVLVCLFGMVGATRAYGLDSSDPQQLEALTALCGVIGTRLAGISTMGAVLNYALSALGGCLAYMLPCMLAHFSTISRQRLQERFSGNAQQIEQSQQQARREATHFFVQALKGELFKFVFMVIILGLCFKQQLLGWVTVCSFVLLVVVTMVLVMITLGRKAKDKVPAGPKA